MIYLILLMPFFALCLAGILDTFVWNKRDQ